MYAQSLNAPATPPKHVGNLSSEIVLSQKSQNWTLWRSRKGDARMAGQCSMYAQSLNAPATPPKHVGNLSSEIVLSQKSQNWTLWRSRKGDALTLSKLGVN